MNIDFANPRVILFGILNIPVLIGLGRLFFSSWSEFFTAFIPNFDFGFWSWVMDIHARANWENMKLVIFTFLAILLLYGEYQFFFPSRSIPKNPISQPSKD